MKRACVKLFIAAIIALGCHHAVQAVPRCAAADDYAIGGYYTNTVPDSTTLLPNRSLKQHLDAIVCDSLLPRQHQRILHLCQDLILAHDL